MKTAPWIPFFRRHIHLIVLIGIVALGIWLRVSKLSFWLWDMAAYDESRDMLVAKHIIEYGESVRRGPFASGGMFILDNSAFYYYFLSGLWFFTRSAFGLAFFWASLMGTMPIVAYAIGKKIWNKTTGVVLASLFAFHPQLILLSVQIGQPILTPLWIMYLLWLLVWGGRYPMIWLVIVTGFMFLGLHIHYSTSLYLPALLLWSYRRWLAFNTRLPRVISVLFPIITAEYFFLLWVYTTFRVAPFDQFNFLAVHGPRFFEKFWEHTRFVWYEMSDDLWYGLGSQRNEWLTVVLIALGLFYTKSASAPKIRSFMIWIFVTGFSAYVFLGLYSGFIHLQYFLELLPLLLIVLGFVLSVIREKNKILGFVLVMGICIHFVTRSFSEVSRTYPESFYDQNKTLAQVIREDFSRQPRFSAANREHVQLPAFTLATLSESTLIVYDQWATGSVWFWLEELYDKQLVRLINSDVSFQPLVTDPVFLYFICDHRHYPNRNEACLAKFIRSRDDLESGHQRIYTTPIYTLWRFTLKQ